MHVKKIQRCRICGNEHLTEVLDLGEQHIQGAFEHPDAPNPPRRKVRNRIVRCDTSKNQNACGLVQADRSVPPEILYSNYWYQSGISKTMTKHLQFIAESARGILGRDKKDLKVLDIGLNDGTLLRHYPESFDKTGIDPSNIAAKQKKDIRVINETYPSDKLFYEEFDVITSIACFYDVNNPQEFVSNIRRNLRPNGIWLAEFAYWPAMIRNLAFDQILAEHVCHYHLAPFEELLRKNRLKLFSAHETPTNGGSIMVYVCREECGLYDKPELKEQIRQLHFDEFEMTLDEEDIYKDFADKVHKSLHNLECFVESEISKGKTIHLYGASTKMNVILEAANLGPKQIPYAAERCKEKFGAKTLSGIRVISEKESKKLKPDYYLCSLIGFQKEILEREKEFLESGGKFIFPLPELHVVDELRVPFYILND